MSVRVMSWVFEHSETTGNDRLVLLAIADEADDDGGNAFPSIGRIANKSRVNARTVRRSIERLEKDGALKVLRPEHQGRGHFNRYVVILPQKEDTLTSLPMPEGGQKEAEGGHDEPIKGAKRGAQVSPNPMTHKYKPEDPRVLERFEKFWKAYPPRGGKKLGKEASRSRFVKLSYEDQRAAWVGANYLAEAITAGGKFGPPDPERWLRDRKWEDWQEPADVSPNGKSEPQSWSMAYTQ